MCGVEWGTKKAMCIGERKGEGEKEGKDSEARGYERLEGDMLRKESDGEGGGGEGIKRGGRRDMK